MFQELVKLQSIKRRCERHLEEILNVPLLGIAWDSYDDSFEIYPMTDDEITMTPEQHDKIIKMGCGQYWINFPNGDEQHCTNSRIKKGSDNWTMFNNDLNIKRQASLEINEAYKIADKAMLQEWEITKSNESKEWLMKRNLI